MDNMVLEGATKMKYVEFSLDSSTNSLLNMLTVVVNYDIYFNS